ncbi:MAG TPA: hypothetical protein VFT22_40360 [Kofleriaceae bacterium]|nr:hypothetical protein [Kofleriaceae bacterium]
MKPDIDRRRLTLDKDILRALAPRDLTEVAGGSRCESAPTITACPACEDPL